MVPTLSKPDESEIGAFVTRDCLAAYWSSVENGDRYNFRATRTSVTAPWSTPVRVTDFATTGGNQEDPWLAPDQRTFLFTSDVSGSKDLYISTR